MPFFNREENIKQMKAILSGEPNLLWFVYGPINSGKTALLMKVFEELSEEYRVFYVNFRERDVKTVEDLMRVLFRVKVAESQKISEFLKEILKGEARIIEKLGGIPIPENIFDLLFREVKKVEDVFVFLREYFSILKEEGFRPVFVLDEMQTIKEVINVSGKPIIARLFNFLVRLTKETHLCHCLCATSDCLFIEDVYSNARLEGRAKYLLVDDLSKEDAFRIYEEFGFEDKELIWDYIGGKIGDIVGLHEEKKRYPEKEALESMLKNEMARLEGLLEKIEAGNRRFCFEGKEILVDIEKIKEVFLKFREREEISKKEIDPIWRNYLVYENILFYNPMEGTVRPQSRLLWRAIKETVKDLSEKF